MSVSVNVQLMWCHCHRWGGRRTVLEAKEAWLGRKRGRNRVFTCCSRQATELHANTTAVEWDVDTLMHLFAPPAKCTSIPMTLPRKFFHALHSFLRPAQSRPPLTPGEWECSL